jgi:hypothetical protein
MDGKRRIENIARWWAQASEESRFGLMRRVLEGRQEAKGPTLEEVQLGALLAEASQGEVEGRPPQEGIRGR